MATQSTQNPTGTPGAPRRWVLWERKAERRLLILAVVLGLSVGWIWVNMIRMPGKSYRGALPPVTPEQARLAQELEADVRVLAVDIGDRNLMQPSTLDRAAEWIEGRLRASGRQVSRQTFRAMNETCANLEAVVPGTDNSEQEIVVGAHYDTAPGPNPGADDNASGVAGMLALARRFADRPHARTLRFVAFANEEPPFFQTETMGSWVYARHLRESHADVVAMLSLECLGYYSSRPGSQKYPPPFQFFYPSQGNFIAFVGDRKSTALVRRSVREFRRAVRFPSEGVATFGGIPGIGWSDHWSFWRHDFRALMVTDTAPFRNPHYHAAGDTIETVDFDSMARVVEGLASVISVLATGDEAT